MSNWQRRQGASLRICALAAMWLAHCHLKSNEDLCCRGSRFMEPDLSSRQSKPIRWALVAFPGLKNTFGPI